VDVRMTLISGNKPGVNCSLLILRDITKRKNIEDSLNKANQELEKRITEIQILQNQLKEESIRDPLTRLYNRRYMEDALQREFAHATRDGYPVSIIMADIDHFKKVNDTYGHAAGDEVLEQLSRTFMANFRMEDIVCRYGGEEFLIVMPETTAETAFLRIDNLRQQLESSDLNVTGAALRITLSAGIAVYPAEGSTIDEVVQKADQAMYRAKKEGRNRVIAGGFPA
jgi:diguanylate cyclase (GGDEF)-like protein